MLSPLTVVPVKTAVVFVDVVWAIVSVVVVRSWIPPHAQPLGAYIAGPIVTVTVQVPVVPEAKTPLVAPPLTTVAEQPETEKMLV